MSERNGLDDAAAPPSARRQLLISLLERELRGRSDLRVLDVGCGAGEMLLALSRFGEVYGVDPAPELVERGRQRGLHNIRLAELERLPVESGTVDLLVLIDALARVADQEALLAECRRALARDGLALISVPRRAGAGAAGLESAELRWRLLDAGLRPQRITHFDLLLAQAEKLGSLAGGLRARGWLARGIAAAPGTAARAELWLLERWNLPVGRSLLALARG